MAYAKVTETGFVVAAHEHPCFFHDGIQTAMDPSIVVFSQTTRIVKDKDPNPRPNTTTTLAPYHGLMWDQWHPMPSSDLPIRIEVHTSEIKNALPRRGWHGGKRLDIIIKR